MTPKLPNSTWQLEAGDMCKNTIHRKNRSCLLGWIENWSTEDQDPLEDDAAEVVYKALRETGCIHMDVGMGEYNDTHTLDHNARVWNTTMKRLGYDIDEEACL